MTIACSVLWNTDQKQKGEKGFIQAYAPVGAILTQPTTPIVMDWNLELWAKLNCLPFLCCFC